jgi:hypothetical protein
MMRSFVPYVMFWLTIDVILIKLCDTGQLLANAGIDYNLFSTDIRCTFFCTFSDVVFYNFGGKLFFMWGGGGCSSTNYSCSSY